MGEPFSKCLLTGAPVKDLHWNDMGSVVHYSSELTGQVSLGAKFAQELLNNGQYSQPILAGFFRQKHESQLEAPIVLKEDARRIIEAKAYPLDFDQRTGYLLRFLYEHGGNEYRGRNIQSWRDFPICYAESGDELIRLLHALVQKGLITVGKISDVSLGRKNFHAVTITESGFAAVEKNMPADHLTGLIRGKIQTGLPDLDAKINHASELFNSANGELENIRSACIALSAVLERYRDDLSIAFAKKDTDTFFTIVNAFDIRHSKDSTNQIEHPEQLEWIYFTLLNSIQTYCKLKARLQSSRSNGGST